MTSLRFPTLTLVVALAGALSLGLDGCSKPVPVPDAPLATPPAVEVSDMDVTTRVKTALLNNDATKAFEVAVVTTKGDVRLTGVMDSQLQIDQALALTRAIEGVHTVHDELSVKR